MFGTRSPSSQDRTLRHPQEKDMDGARTKENYFSSSLVESSLLVAYLIGSSHYIMISTKVSGEGH